MTLMPYMPGVIRQVLLKDEVFQRLLRGGTISCREVPDPLTKPHVTVKMVGHQTENPLLRRLLIQVTPWVPAQDVTGLDEDPDVTAWNLAHRAGELLGAIRNQVIDSDDVNAYSAHWVDGPIQLEDSERGADRMIYYAPIRIAAHVRRRI